MPKPAVWGSELSPFALKLRALLDYAAVDYRWLPADGSWLENLRAQWRIARAKRTRTALRYPQLDPLDEYPLVPYLLEPGGRVQYDASALAHWLDDHHPPAAGPFRPPSPALGFVAQLVDEAFDELGLYLVHHNRWVLSAATNDAGVRLAREYRRVLPPGAGPAFARWFARRQVRRLPYLFSVAPPGIRCAVAPELVPPARAGFPPTHALLDAIWEEALAAVEGVLVQQPFLLGDRFTVADAAVYGQLGMNLADRTAAERVRALAPTTYGWLTAIRDRRHVGSTGPLRLAPSLAPLLALLATTFVPLMRQNAHAYEAARAGGETVFNEPAFAGGRAHYDGALRGQPFRAVVKTFQVRVWRELCDAWAALPAAARTEVAALLPAPEALAP
jgi:glutathione S-transferase